MAGLLEPCFLAFQLCPISLALQWLAGPSEAATPPTWKVAPLPPRRLLKVPDGSQSRKGALCQGLESLPHTHNFASKWSRNETGFPRDLASLATHGHLDPCRTLGLSPRFAFTLRLRWPQHPQWSAHCELGFLEGGRLAQAYSRVPLRF